MTKDSGRERGRWRGRGVEGEDMEEGAGMVMGMGGTAVVAGELMVGV